MLYLPTYIPTKTFKIIYYFMHFNIPSISKRYYLFFFLSLLGFFFSIYLVWFFFFSSSFEKQRLSFRLLIKRKKQREEKGIENIMKDWAAPIIAAALFAFLSPGLVFQIPGKGRPLDFMNMKTSAASIFVHMILYGLLLILFIVILHIHLYV